ncbi:MAG: 4Fe-4S binding protein [Betaproteobacteria bacterium]
MTHVVTGACFKCVPRRCVVVCPVDCFHEGDQFVVIDPDRCIDCAECVIECPVEAIYEKRHMPEGEKHFSMFNAEMARNWPLLPIPLLVPPQSDKIS